MTGPVDVLGVFDRIAYETVEPKSAVQAREMREAREAMAELISAVREYRAELRRPIGVGTYNQVVARVDVALARVGGAK